MARAAEDAGADSLWVADHLVMVDRETTDYPYSPDGKPGWNVEADIFESFSCCALMAGVTSRCELGTAVVVLPQRNTLEVAKVAATIDALSGGRFVLGVGAGWNSQEFAALGYSFADRGPRMSEMLQVLRASWAGRPTRFDGEHVKVPAGVVLHPRPVRNPGPPLLVGGNSDAALRRAAEFGDGWLGTTSTRKFDRERDALQAALETVKELRSGFDRKEPFRLALKLNVPAENAELVRQVSEVARIGFDDVLIDVPWAKGIDAAAAAVFAVRAGMQAVAA
jgi:probable F420-dependent oxidoreductase